MRDSAAVVTIGDIARELGVSKSTVSRVINCKGRIGADTRKRVMERVEALKYTPNPMAKGLVLRKTYNIGVVVPKDADKGDIPFFQNCLVGISEHAYKLGYDTLLAVQDGDDITPLRRLVTNRKVDGVVLTRLEENDEAVEFLKKEDIPFVVMGTSDDDTLYQIDSDQTAGCYEMTKFMIRKGCTRVVVLAGNRNYRVNWCRYEGFAKAWKESGLSDSDRSVFWDVDMNADLERVLPEVLKENPQCLVCMDDAICVSVLKWLRQNDYEVPEDIQVISFYDNPVLENNSPPVTALNVNVFTLTKRASALLVDAIEGRQVPVHTNVNYELKIRASFR